MTCLFIIMQTNVVAISLYALPSKCISLIILNRLPNKHSQITRAYSMYEEHFIRKTVSLIKCECPLLEHGCKWIGSLENCEKHLDKCITSMRR